jgi:hypothetical protein
VLKDRQLRWFSSDTDLAPSGVIDFDLVVVEVEQLWHTSEELAAESREPKRSRGTGCFSQRGSCFLKELFTGSSTGFSFRVCPVGSNRAFELRVDGQEDAELWVRALEQQIRQADSRMRRSPATLDSFGRTSGAWWKVSRISPKRFEQLADTGDVLLFRSRGSMPRVIRAASGNGRFDHVALLLRLDNGDVGLLEATGNNGVGVVEWKEFIANQWQSLYPELALRRVFIKRSPDVMRRLQDWCGEVIGKPYGLTISKLRQRNSVSQGGEDTNSDFFCSQLVAEGLKVAGAIPRGLSSTQYWPNTFSASSETHIKCEKGVSFDAVDLTIDFSLADPADKPKGQIPASGQQRDATTNW